MAGAARLSPSSSVPSLHHIERSIGPSRFAPPLSFFSRLLISGDGLSSSSRSIRASLAVSSWGGDEDPKQHNDVLTDNDPTSIKLEPIVGEERFDRIIADAQQLEEEVVILWMASWCRKCIYLKPKLEKLAVDYYPRVRFYCVDVNLVPQRLVNRAGISKMPTIQLWKDCKKEAEVIGGHKAWLVVNDVRQMIDNQYY